MKIEKITTKCRCDFGLCKNLANYVITEKGAMSKRNVYICNDCMKELYTLIGSQIVPKSPDSLIYKAEKKRGENI